MVGSMESRRTRTGRVLQRRKSRFLSNGRNEGKQECLNPSFSRWASVMFRLSTSSVPATP